MFKIIIDNLQAQLLSIRFDATLPEGNNVIELIGITMGRHSATNLYEIVGPTSDIIETIKILSNIQKDIQNRQNGNLPPLNVKIPMPACEPPKDVGCVSLNCAPESYSAPLLPSEKVSVKYIAIYNVNDYDYGLQHKDLKATTNQEAEKEAIEIIKSHGIHDDNDACAGKQGYKVSSFTIYLVEGQIKIDIAKLNAGLLEHQKKLKESIEKSAELKTLRDLANKYPQDAVELLKAAGQL